MKGRPPGTFRLGTAAEAEERVRFVREHAGGRADAVEWNVLVQHVQVTPDRRAEAERIHAERMPEMPVEEILDTPFVLLGTGRRSPSRSGSGASGSGSPTSRSIPRSWTSSAR